MAYKFQNGDARLSGSTTFEDALAGLQSLDIDGQATLASAVVEGALDVDGATTLDGLNVSEVASFAADITASAGLLIGAELHVDGAATLASAAVEGAFDVDGATTLDGLTVAEAAQFDAGVAIDGAIDANSTSNFQGDMQLQAALDVDGVATLASANIEGALDVDGATTLDGLTVAEAAVFSAAVQIDGAIDANSSANFQGAVVLQSSLDVDGATSLDGLSVSEVASFAADVTASAGMLISEELHVDGAATLASAAVEGAFDVDGATTLDGLTVAEAAQFDAAVAIDGALDANGTSDFQGAMNLQAGITVAGAADFNSTSDFQGDMNLQADLDVAGGSTVQAIVIQGAIDANSTSDFQGAMNLQAGITIAGAADLNGSLDVDGQTDLDVLNVAEVASFAADITASAGLLISQELHVDGASTLASAKIEDLTDNRLVLAGTSGELQDSAVFTYIDDQSYFGTFDALIVSSSARGNTVVADGALYVGQSDGSDLLLVQSQFGDASVAIGDDENIMLYASGVSEFGGNMTVDGTSEFAGNMTVSGASDVGLNVSSKMTGGASITSIGHVGVGQSGTFAAMMFSTGIISGSSNLQMGGDLISAGALDINGSARSDIANDLKVGGDLIIAGDIHFSGSLEIDGDLQVDGDVLFSDVAGTMAIANDALYFRDADDGKLKSYSWDSLMDSVAGAGLTNTNGQLSADGASAPNAIGDANATLAEGFNYGSSALTANRAWALPAPQEVGDTVHVKAPAGCSATNYIAISGGTIDGDLTELRLESPYAAVSLICVNVASDLWRIY